MMAGLLTCGNACIEPSQRLPVV